jgi:DtxR family Mn-dependent transcriptional regulator
MAQRHSVDEYLETIWFLAFPIGEYRPTTTGTPTLASRVAEMLGVSRASAGEMLKRLEKEGLVERGEHKEAILTESGRERAERVVRRHRIIERLLTDFMGYTAAEAHVHADELGDTFSDDMIVRMEEKLGYPERCPHGWPVDTALEQRENRELVALSELGAGDRATIVRLAEHDGRAPALVLRPGLRARDEGRGQGHTGRSADRQDERRRADDRRPRRVGPLRQAVVAAPETPAASRSASALSVRSHVKSWSSRPKCPYAAVFA